MSLTTGLILPCYINSNFWISGFSWMIAIQSDCYTSNHIQTIKSSVNMSNLLQKLFKISSFSSPSNIGKSYD